MTRGLSRHQDHAQCRQLSPTILQCRHLRLQDVIWVTQIVQVHRLRIVRELQEYKYRHSLAFALFAWHVLDFRK
jgi:hypothetical protein